MSDGAIPVFDALRNRCEADLEKLVEANHPTAENLLKKNPDEAIARAAAYERYPTPRFAEPIFIGVGLSDIVAFAEGQYDFAMAACYSHSIVELHDYPGKDHSGTVNASLVDSVPFVRKLFAGQPILRNCASIKAPVPGKMRSS